MKISFSAIVSTALASTTAAVEYSVGSCADLIAVDETALTSLIVTSSPIECDDYLRFVVRNDMTLSATVPEVELSNIALKIKDGLVVVIEPDIVFRDVFEVVKNGGALSISKECAVTFMGTVKFINNSVLIKQLPPVTCGEGCTTIGRGLSYVAKKGGAVHNKGDLTFQGDASFLGCYSQTDDSVETSRGGAISNNAPGVIHFMGDLTMESNEAEGFFEGQGGAIYNRGDIVVDGDVVFYDNDASDGGGIYQEKWGTFEINGMSNFTNNVAFESRGGAICNLGGVVNINGGSVFHDNGASCSGECGSGGAIYNSNGGAITLTGPTTFSENSAWYGGAIFNMINAPSYYDDEEVAEYETPVITFPDDTVFIGNSAECGVDFFDGEYDTCST